MNGTHQLLASADDMNLLGDNIETLKKNIGMFNDASKEFGLEVEVETTKYMLVFHHQNAGQNLDIRIANRSYENIMTVTDQNLIQEEIKRRLNSGNACYHSVQNFLSSCLLSKYTN
jgi:hypothetical protein